MINARSTVRAEYTNGSLIPGETYARVVVFQCPGVEKVVVMLTTAAVGPDLISDDQGAIGRCVSK